MPTPINLSPANFGLFGKCLEAVTAQAMSTTYRLNGDPSRGEVLQGQPGDVGGGALFYIILAYGYTLYIYALGGRLRLVEVVDAGAEIATYRGS